MKLCVLVLFTCALTLGKKKQKRIIGGVETSIEKHPHQAAFYYRGELLCGGSILNKDTILTAAHCVHELKYHRMTVRVGATDHTKGETYIVSRVIPNPNFNKDAPYNYDMAILKLDRHLKFSSKVRPIILQPSNKPVPVGTIATVTGWGVTKFGLRYHRNNLRAVDVTTTSWKECHKIFKPWGDRITDKMMCANAPHKDACQGDSGGPLVANGRLIGVVSWGYSCAHPNYPGVYADVVKMHTFITKHM